MTDIFDPTDFLSSVVHNDIKRFEDEQNALRRKMRELRDGAVFTLDDLCEESELDRRKREQAEQADRDYLVEQQKQNEQRITKELDDARNPRPASFPAPDM